MGGPMCTIGLCVHNTRGLSDMAQQSRFSRPAGYAIRRVGPVHDQARECR